MAAATAGLSVGTRCYIPDAAHVWLPVCVEQVDERARTAVVQPLPLPGQDAATEREHAKRRDVQLDTKDAKGSEFPLQNLAAVAREQGVDNMISLDHLHEAAILHNLRKRFAAGLPYTYTGDICVAVNPYRWLDALYARELHAQYLRAETPSALPPHVYAVAVAAFRHLRDDAQNQSILVSGESGAGKTETTKIVMDNLATIAAAPVSGSRPGTQDGVSSDADQRQQTIRRIVEVNPLLESFGNATTKRNDNSSRFGKFTQLQFDGANVLCGAQCETYLLEKTRVVTQDPGERNYHIFYQLLHGASTDEKAAFGLDQAPVFSYLRRDDDVHTDKVVARDVRNYGRTKQALGLLGLYSQQQEAIFRAIAGILHLGEASFVPLAGNEDASSLDSASVALSSVLLGIDTASMNKGLCNRTMRVGGGEVYAVPLTPAQAAAGRDALAKAIYSRLFDWMVVRINESLSADDAERGGDGGAIGVLDIFGFESFTHNSFEQLCINYANEKLQQKFTLDVFRAVQDEYASEGISWDHISYPDNCAVLALIEGKLGVIALLNEETVRPKGSAEGFVSKLATAYRKEKHLIEFPRLSRTQFAIHHYAEKVTYEAHGFLEKHKDSLLSDLSDLMLASNEPFVQSLFYVEPVAPASPASINGRSSSRKVGGGNDSSKTVGNQFKVSLSKLMETITATNVHYIRCIKPNSVKSPEAFDSRMVVNQLRCAGVIEAVTIARAGYPNRMAHEAFVEQFDIFLSEEQQASGDHARNCHVLAAHFTLSSPDEFQMGKTKIYLQKGVVERLERARAERLFAYAARIQSRWRGVLARTWYAILRAALVVIQRRAKVFVAQCRFQKQQLGVRTIQRVYRGHQGRLVYHAKRRERAAMRIQSGYRGMQGRRVFFAVLCQSKALRIQCAVRQHLARKAFAVRRAEFEAEQAKLAAEERERQRIAREEQLRREEEERERQRIELEERLRREEEERVERLRREEEERLEQQRREEEQRLERLRREEEERLERLRREEEERQLLALQEKSAVQIQRYARGFSGRRLFRELVLEKEQEAARLAEEAELERQRVLQEQQELEAARRAAEEAERERVQQAEERKRQALQRRQQREHAAVKVQSVVRGRLQRQKFAELKVTREGMDERDEELERVRAENESLRRQLEQLLETNHELESLVAEWKCERDVLLASNNLREIELTQQLSSQKKELDGVRREFSTLCDYMEKNSAGSTEPDDLHSDDENEDVEVWDDDSSSSDSDASRSSFERDSSGPTASSSSSFFEGDRPSADVSMLMRPSRATNLAARTSRLGASLVQRRQAASRTYQRGKEEAGKKLSASATVAAVSRAKKWVGTARKNKDKAAGGGGDDRAPSKHHYEPRSMEF